MSRRIFWMVLPLLVCAFAVPAFAEEPSGEELKERIKKQMEKILDLMKKNESALLELSTGAEAEPKRVDVDVDTPKGEQGKSGSGTDAGAKGRDIAEKMDELIGGQRKGGKAIPGELKRLVEMIPL